MQEKVLEYLAGIAKKKRYASELNADSDLSALLADSLDLAHFIVFAQKDLKVRLSLEDVLDRSHFRTPASIVKLLGERNV